MERYDPDLWTDEFTFLSQPGQVDIQSDLFYDYRTNVDAYPKWQAWMRERQPRLLVIWGKYDLSFELSEPESYRRDVPNAEVHVLDAGHFALEYQSRRNCGACRSQFVWSEILRLLEDPELVQAEIDRRRAAARNADPLRKRQEELRLEQVRIEKNSDRLVTAYQEGLVTLPQLRQRMPALQKQAQAVGSELQSLEMAAVDEARYLQLAAIQHGRHRERAGFTVDSHMEPLGQQRLGVNHSGETVRTKTAGSAENSARTVLRRAQQTVRQELGGNEARVRQDFRWPLPRGYGNPVELVSGDACVQMQARVGQEWGESGIAQKSAWRRIKSTSSSWRTRCA